MRYRSAIAAAFLGASIAVVPVASAVASVGAHEFKNCTDMHHTYPHGVGTLHARDHTSGTPVTNFKRSNALYTANKKSDRDGDHIACEAR